MNECRRRVEQALAHIGAKTVHDARLSTALSLPRMYGRGPLEEINAAWSTTLALAEQVGDADYQLRGIWGLFAGSINSGDFRAALELAEGFRDLATDPGRSADRPAPHRDGAAFPRRSGSRP